MLIPFGEIVRGDRLNVQHTDNLAFRNQGDGHLRADRIERRDVLGILANVIDEHRLCRRRRTTGDAFPDPNPQGPDHVFRMAETESNREFLCLLIEQEDCKHLVIDDPFHGLCNARHQFVQREDGGELVVGLEH